MYTICTTPGIHSKLWKRLPKWGSDKEGSRQMQKSEKMYYDNYVHKHRHTMCTKETREAWIGSYSALQHVSNLALCLMHQEVNADVTLEM